MIEPLLCCAAPETRAEARRRQIIEVARKLFIANGFHATGVAQISENSGIAVGQIYRDFSCKEDIVAAIVTEDCAQFMDARNFEAAIATHDGSAIREWIDHFFEPAPPEEGDRLFAEIVAESSRNPRIAAIFRDLQRQFEDRLLQALALLSPGDDYAPQRQALADAIMTFSIGLQQHRLFCPELHLPPLSDMLKSMIGRELELLNEPASS